MQSTGRGGPRIVVANNQHRIYSIAFADNGKQLWSGGVEGKLRRWQADDGHEVGEPIRANGAKIYAVAVSPDHKWLVCGLKFPDSNDGKAWVGVWDVRTQEKVLDVYGHTDSVLSVHISSDSTKFATGGSDKLAFIYNMATGERLVGPLQHDGWVVAVQFSPNNDRIATVSAENPDAKSIRIYNSDSGQRLLNIPFSAKAIVSSPLAWSLDGHQLLAVSYGETKCFDTSSGSLLGGPKWIVPGKGQPTSIVLARNGKFIIISSHNTLSFWDAITHKEIGAAIKLPSVVWSIALSTDYDCIATGEENGSITFRSLRGVLPDSYFAVKVSKYFGSVSEADPWWSFLFFCPSYTSQLPLMCINDTVLRSWTHGNLTRVEQLLTEEIVQPSDPLHHARALAHRSLVRSRLKRWETALDDAKKSIEAQRSVIGHIANAFTYVGSGDYELAMRVFDLVFTNGLAIENNFLLLIKAIILFLCGKPDTAILRVDDLIDIVDDRPLCSAVQAQMLLLRGGMSSKDGDNEEALEFLGRAQKAIPLQFGPHLAVISLIFGWDFDKLGHAIQTQLQECIKQLEDGDAIVSEDPTEAIKRYSTALSLNPSNLVLLIKRSKARAMLKLWEGALQDADKAVKIDPLSPWGHKRRHAALHGLQRYGEAVTAFKRMLSLIEESPDQDARQLAKKYISPTQSVAVIDNAVREVSKMSPLVLIDVKSGRLCDEPERALAFKSESKFNELLSSSTEKLDNERVQGVVEEYFQYVTLSHVWQGKEPLLQDVKSAGTVWSLDSSPLNEKLRKFCEVVHSNGYRWAWSDTCCIDKTNGAVLSKSLIMMYKWYEASVATYALLATAPSPSNLGDLRDSIWMTRAWTAQELLAAKVIRFYDRDWKPYLDDTQPNHKESPKIMQELVDAIGIARETIVAFNPDYLSVREKLRVASTRNATVEEDMAYSLIGIFKSDIVPRYGEGDAAVGHLLEEIVTRSGEVTVLDWAGKSSSYNTCLPDSLAVYSQPPRASLAINDAEMGERVEALRNALFSETDAIEIHERVTHLHSARLTNRRLYLPCIIFSVKKLTVQDFGRDQETRYRARVSGIGDVDFQTLDHLSPSEPRRLIFVHPWIRNLLEPLDESHWASTVDDGYESDPEGVTSFVRRSPMPSRSATTMDDYTRALRFIARLQQPFHALLLQQELSGEFKRVAAEHEIVVPGLERQIKSFGDIQTKVVEIL